MKHHFPIIQLSGKKKKQSLLYSLLCKLNSYNKLYNEGSNEGINQGPWKHCDREGNKAQFAVTPTGTLCSSRWVSPWPHSESCFVLSHFSHSTGPAWYNLPLPRPSSQSQAIRQHLVQLHLPLANSLITFYSFNHQISIEYYYVYSLGQPPVKKEVKHPTLKGVIF